MPYDFMLPMLRILATIIIPVLILVLLGAVPALLRRRRYNRSVYRSLTGLSYGAVVGDKGRYGEYLTGLELERLPGHYRVLYNLYVPRADGTTSEIDLVFIHQSGVYVIESKNYSGRVYGSRDDRYWTVVLAGGKRKERLYNPLRQNQGHVTALSAFLPWSDPSIIHSIVVFSVRCVLAKVPADTPTAMTIKRDWLVNALRLTSGNTVLNVDQINYLFSVLQPLTQVSSDVKDAHIVQVANTASRMPIPPSWQPPPSPSPSGRPEMKDDVDQIKPYSGNVGVPWSS